uniref:Uncharacterized protein n=1 Tax=Arundo donax TaxID=35708 RepID=A0A0A9D592_ARUDO
MGVMLGLMVVLAMGLVMTLQVLVLVLLLGLALVDSMVLGQAMVALVLLVVTIHMEDRKAWDAAVAC